MQKHEKKENPCSSSSLTVNVNKCLKISDHLTFLCCHIGDSSKHKDIYSMKLWCTENKLLFFYVVVTLYDKQHEYKNNLACVLIRFFFLNMILLWTLYLYSDLVGVHLYLPLFLQCCCSPLQIQRTLNQRWRKTSLTCLCTQTHVTFLGLSEFIMT